MISFKATLEKFEEKGEKSGWTYINIPSDIANQLYPKYKKSFRVKGILDTLKINGVALLPMGKGDFILPINIDMRKVIQKPIGEKITVQIIKDNEEYQLNALLLECLQEDKIGYAHFNAMPRSHQNYYSKYVDSAKTDSTKAKRVALICRAMHQKQSYAEMLRSAKEF
jgi:hypothetical protein